jgi:hypothetical protein
MYTELIRQKMTELAEGKFTYKPTRDILPEVISDIYESSPVYFGLMGKIINDTQGVTLDANTEKPIDPAKKVYLLISEENHPVALLNCIIDYPEDGSVFLGWMIVHGQHLFKGIGRSNYQIFSRAIKSLGMKQIHILIETHNEAATTFWTGLGFKQVPGFAKKATAYDGIGTEYYLDLNVEETQSQPL